VLSMLMMVPAALDSATELTILHETMVLIDAALSACQRRNDVVPVLLETPSSEEVRLRTYTYMHVPLPNPPIPTAAREEAGWAYKTRTLPSGGARVSRRVSAQLGCQAQPAASPATAMQLHLLTTRTNMCVCVYVAAHISAGILTDARGPVHLIEVYDCVPQATAVGDVHHDSGAGDRVPAYQQLLRRRVPIRAVAHPAGHRGAAHVPCRHELRQRRRRAAASGAGWRGVRRYSTLR
jgi:hypothetical protein